MVTWVTVPLSARSVTTTSAGAVAAFANVTRAERRGSQTGRPGQNQTVLDSARTAALGATFAVRGGVAGRVAARPEARAAPTSTTSTTTNASRRDLKLLMRPPVIRLDGDGSRTTGRP